MSNFTFTFEGLLVKINQFTEEELLTAMNVYNLVLAHRLQNHHIAYFCSLYCISNKMCDVYHLILKPQGICRYDRYMSPYCSVISETDSENNFFFL